MNRTEKIIAIVVALVLLLYVGMHLPHIVAMDEQDRNSVEVQ
jgi:hypothetical protein